MGRMFQREGHDVHARRIRSTAPLTAPLFFVPPSDVPHHGPAHRALQTAQLPAIVIANALGEGPFPQSPFEPHAADPQRHVIETTQPADLQESARGLRN